MHIMLHADTFFLREAVNSQLDVCIYACPVRAEKQLIALDFNSGLVTLH